MKSILITLLLILSNSEFAMASDWCTSAANLKCMKDAINGEARGEGYNGMLMVGKTIATRMARGYKSSVCSTVNGSGFATSSSYPTRGGAMDTRANSNIAKAAALACKMGDQGVSHFHSYKSQASKSAPWSSQFTFVTKVGRHYFFNAPMTTKAYYEIGDGDLKLNNFSEEPAQLIQEPYSPPPEAEDSSIAI